VLSEWHGGAVKAGRRLPSPCWGHHPLDLLSHFTLWQLLLMCCLRAGRTLHGGASPFPHDTRNLSNEVPFFVPCLRCITPQSAVPASSTAVLELTLATISGIALLVLRYFRNFDVDIDVTDAFSTALFT
jgi:hypothetical protein